MVQAAHRQDAIAAQAGAVPFLAADVGGTHARIGLACAEAGHAMPRLLAYRKYVCANWPSLAAILGDFVLHESAQPVTRCALAIAGYAIDDRIVNGNLAWPVSLRELRQQLGMDEVAQVNDFAALAYAIEQLGSDAGTVLTQVREGSASGPRLVLGPGTGFGASLLIPHGPKPLVLATEAGQVALAPRTALERDILDVLADGDRHVSTESALSGPGIVNLYGAIAVLRGIAPTQQTPKEIVAAAKAGDDAMARQALQVFCGLLGSFVGDLAMVFGASGGVYLAGGVLAHLGDVLPHSDFVKRFLDKGGMRAFLERVPVRLLDHGRLGVLGAAGWYIEQGGAR